jgi:hypothetical protein
MFKKLKYSFISKTLAFILLVIFAFVTLFNGMGCLTSFNENFFTKTKKEVTDDLYSNISYEISTLIHNSSYFDYNGDIYVSYGRNYNVTELADFVIYNSDTNEVLHTSPNQIGSGYIAKYYSYFKAYYNSLNGDTIDGIKIEVKLKPLSKNSVLKLREKLIIFYYDNRFSNLISFLISFLITASMFCFLLYSAGHKKGSENISTGFLEKIPFDIFTLIIGSIMVILFLEHCLFLYTLEWLQQYLDQKEI